MHYKKGGNLISLSKKVLLIAGGGTLGTYVSRELLKMGCSVDIICPEEKISDNKKLTFYQDYVSEELLNTLFLKNYYDGIVNFIHYINVKEYRKFHDLLINNTDHLIFLSSYRVYADDMNPITENAPRLLDVSKDIEFLDNENYAVPKAKCEDFLHTECKGQPWTVVRPVISFSDKRFDLYVYSNDDILNHAKSGVPILLPDFAKTMTAGIDWAGNTGKLIANLLFKPKTHGECYTISSGQNLKWGEVADIYEKFTGVNVEWVCEEDFIESYPCLKTSKKWLYLYDRKFDRKIDNKKVLSATGLKKEDFIPIACGIEMELKKLSEKGR